MYRNLLIFTSPTGIGTEILGCFTKMRDALDLIAVCVKKDAKVVRFTMCFVVICFSTLYWVLVAITCTIQTFINGWSGSVLYTLTIAILT